MTIQPTSNKSILFDREKVTTDISNGVAWGLMGFGGFFVGKLVQAFLPPNLKEAADKAGVLAEMSFAMGIVGVAVQSKDHVNNFVPAFDVVVSYIKPVVRPIVDGVEFAGTKTVESFVSGMNYFRGVESSGAEKTKEKRVDTEVKPPVPSSSSSTIDAVDKSAPKKGWLW